MKPHHLHASVASSGVSADIGTDTRVRVDSGLDRDAKRAVIHRIAVLWNMHEGIPTDVLEAGAVRKFYDAVQSLLNALKNDDLLPQSSVAAAAAVEAAWEGITIEPTADGRRADCPCSEPHPPKEQQP